MAVRFAAVEPSSSSRPSSRCWAGATNIKRLRAIAADDRFRGCVQSVTLNFAEVHEYNARHTSYFQHYLQEPETRSAVLTDAWTRYGELEKRRKAVVPFDRRGPEVDEAFGRLLNVKDLVVTFTRCPFDIDVLRDAFDVPNSRKVDREAACRKLNIIVSALRRMRVASLALDFLPLELFRARDSRRLWFGCADAFARLERVALTVDTSAVTLPSASLRTVNSLGNVLRRAAALTHLSLAFQNHLRPRGQVPPVVRPPPRRLHLRPPDRPQARERHVRRGRPEGLPVPPRPTLQRLRLGGPGPRHELRARQGRHPPRPRLFPLALLRLRDNNRLPQLQRFHMEERLRMLPDPMTLHESYNFHAVTDDDWNRLEKPKRARQGKRTTDSSEFERFLLEGGEYPGATAAVRQLKTDNDDTPQSPRRLTTIITASRMVRWMHRAYQRPSQQPFFSLLYSSIFPPLRPDP